MEEFKWTSMRDENERKKVTRTIIFLFIFCCGCGIITSVRTCAPNTEFYEASLSADCRPPQKKQTTHNG